MDRNELDSRLRNLIICAISASEAVSAESPYDELDAARARVEKELEKVKAWIIGEAGDQKK
jgi:hypothetical protein